MQTKLFRLTVLNALLLSGFAAAETVPATSEPVADSAELETIYITAEAQAKQQLGSSLITKQDLQRTPVGNDISEIVSKMPGVTLSTNSPGGARGNKRQIDIRAMGPENTLILIDGKPVRSRNAERYGRGGVRNTRGDSNWVPPEMIEKIEVLRGPAAARYGSGAMGGVVNIRTKPITREFHGSVGTYIEQPQSGTGQGATRRANFIVSGPIVQDTLGFRLYGSLNKTSPDDFDINNSVNTGTALSAGREGVRNRDIAGRLQWDISPTQRLIFDATYSRQSNIYNGDTQSSNVLVPAVRNVAFPLIGTETARLYRQSYTLTHRGNWEWGDLESYISFDKTVNSRLPEGLLGSTEGAYNSTTGFSDSILKNYRFGSRADLPLGRHTLTVGAEGGRSVLDDSASMKQTMQTYGNIPWLASTGRSGKGSQNDFAIYVEDNISLNQGRTFLTPGLRWDYNTAFGSTFSPSFNFSHALNENWRIKGGIARAFKAPNLYQTQPNYMLTNASHGCPSTNTTAGIIPTRKITAPPAAPARVTISVPPTPTSIAARAASTGAAPATLSAIKTSNPKPASTKKSVLSSTKTATSPRWPISTTTTATALSTTANSLPPSTPRPAATTATYAAATTAPASISGATTPPPTCINGATEARPFSPDSKAT